MAAWFVDSTSGNDANDGRDNIGVGLATATWTEATLTLTQAGHGYTFAAGDVIYISGGTGATVDLYEVASSTANDIVLVGTSTLPGVGNATDFAAGDLATGDITSSTGPDATLGAANAAHAASDQIWARSGTNYTEILALTTVGLATAPTIWEGYTTTLGDDGQATIDGGSVRASGITQLSTNSYLVFKNLIIQNHTGAGVNTTMDSCTWVRCDALSNGGDGWQLDNGHTFINCRAGGNGGDGIDMDGGCSIHGCLLDTNTNSGVQADEGCIAMSDFFSNGLHAISMDQGNLALRCVLNNTIDGDVEDTSDGITFSTRINWGFVINNLVYDCTTGIRFNGSELIGSANNLNNGHTTPYAGTAGTWDGEVTGAPVFTNEAGGDRTLGSGSPAIGAGTDAAQQLGVSEEISIGAFQVAAAAAGGLLVHPGTSGGARA